MGTTRMNTKGLGVLAALGLASVTGACNTVSPENMDAGLESVRAEMRQEWQEADQQMAQDLNGRIDGVERRMAQMESDLQQMERDFEVTIQRLEDQLRFNVPVYFAFDDATVQTEAQQILDRFGAVAQEYYPQALITVEGFADPSGPEAYNLNLGQRRATAVAEYLTTNTAINTDRVRAVSYGENTARLVEPSEQGPGQAGWQNRRVVLVIDHDGQPPVAAPVSEESSN